MKFVDAHIHLSEYNRKVSEILENAKRSKVVALVSNSMNLETSLLSLRLAEEHPNLVYAALGVHPWNIQNLSPNEMKETIDLIFKQRKKVDAVGEIGLDFHYGRSEELQNLQLKVFREIHVKIVKYSFLAPVLGFFSQNSVKMRR